MALNDPNAVEKVNRTAMTRFIMLKERTVDVLAGSETYTIEREVNEVSFDVHLCLFYFFNLNLQP